MKKARVESFGNWIRFVAFAALKLLANASFATARKLFSHEAEAGC